METGQDTKRIIPAIDTLVLANTLKGILPKYLRGLVFPAMVSFSKKYRSLLLKLASMDLATEELKRRQDKLASGNGQDCRNDLLQKLIMIEKQRGKEVDFTERNIVSEGAVAM